MSQALLKLAAWLLLPSLAASAMAGDRLVASGGVTQIEGAAGGGLVPWALIAGYGTRGQLGASLFHTKVNSQGGFELQSAGGAIGVNDRFELSLSQQRFGLSDTVPGASLRMQTIGAKLRVSGDAVYDQDSWLPQIAVGVLAKRNQDFASVPRALGARNASGIDAYVAATKLFLGAVAGRNLLLNATLRATRANQFGLLGFGGDANDGYRAKPELSAALMLTDTLLVGAEHRSKPNNLSVFKEESAHDLFIAWFVHKQVAITAAAVDLGNIADKSRQHGWYLSGQLSY